MRRPLTSLLFALVFVLITDIVGAACKYLSNYSQEMRLMRPPGLLANDDKPAPPSANAPARPIPLSSRSITLPTLITLTLVLTRLPPATFSQVQIMRKKMVDPVSGLAQTVIDSFV